MNRKAKVIISVLALIAAIAAYPVNMPLMADGTPGALSLLVSASFVLLSAAYLYVNKGSKRLITASVIYWAVLLLSAGIVILSCVTDSTPAVMIIFAMATLPPVFGIPVAFGAVSVLYLIVTGLIPLLFLVFSLILGKKRK